MADTAHTPGPWEVAYLDHNGQRVVRAEHIEVCTCWHHSVGSIEKEMEANARLIAAAPEILAALKSAAAAIGDWSRPTGANGMTSASLSHPLMVEQRLAYDAIAKAEGRQ